MTTLIINCFLGVALISVELVAILTCVLNDPEELESESLLEVLLPISIDTDLISSPLS